MPPSRTTKVPAARHNPRKRAPKKLETPTEQQRPPLPTGYHPAEENPPDWFGGPFSKESTAIEYKTTVSDEELAVLLTNYNRGIRVEPLHNIGPQHPHMVCDFNTNNLEPSPIIAGGFAVGIEGYDHGMAQPSHVEGQGIPLVSNANTMDFEQSRSWEYQGDLEPSTGDRDPQDGTIGGVNGPGSSQGLDDNDLSRSHQGTARETIGRGPTPALPKAIQSSLPNSLDRSTPNEGRRREQQSWHSIDLQSSTTQTPIPPNLLGSSNGVDPKYEQANPAQQGWHSSSTQAHTDSQPKLQVRSSHWEQTSNQGTVGPRIERETSLPSQGPVQPSLQNLSGGSAPNHGQGSPAPQESNDTGFQDSTYNEWRPDVRFSQQGHDNQRYTHSDNGQNDINLARRQQRHGIETGQIYGAPGMRDVAQASKQVPQPSVEVSDFKYDGGESDGDLSDSVQVDRESSQNEDYTGTTSRRKPETTLKGETRMMRGALEHHGDKGWELAVRLDNIRGELRRWKEQGGAYDHPRARGKGRDDITSYHRGHKSWGEERHQRPDVLFRIEQGNHRALSHNPDTWYHQGRVVLDPDDNPILCWREIPLLCSSMMEGWELEAISRTNPAIPLSAIRARMPSKVIKGRKVRKLYDLNTLRMRMSRFRVKAGLIAWNEREGSRQIREELFKLLGQDCFDENSTRPFGRDLTSAEQVRVKASNKGTVPQRSRNKRSARYDDVSDDTSDYHSQGRKRFQSVSDNEGDHHHSWPERSRIISTNNSSDHRTQSGRSIQLTQGNSEYSIHGHPFKGSSGLLTNSVVGHNPNYGQPWAAGDEDEESDEVKPSSPVKRRRVMPILEPSNPRSRAAVASAVRQTSSRGRIIPWGSRVAEAEVHFPVGRPRENVCQRRARIQGRCLRPAPGYAARVTGRSFATSHAGHQGQNNRPVRSHMVISGDESHEEIAPVANDIHLRAYPTQISHEDGISPRENPSGLSRKSANHQLPDLRLAPEAQTGTFYSGGPLSNENSFLPASQMNPHPFEDVMGNQVIPALPLLQADVPPQQAHQIYEPSIVGLPSPWIEPLQSFAPPGGETSEFEQYGLDLAGDIFGENVDLSAFQLPPDGLSTGLDSQQDQIKDFPHDTAQDGDHEQGIVEPDRDFRYEEPQNAEDELNIQRALSFTRNDFHRMSGGIKPSETPRDTSYDFQYTLLKGEFKKAWQLEQSPPALHHFVNRWRSFTDWKVPGIASVF